MVLKLKGTTDTTGGVRIHFPSLPWMPVQPMKAQSAANGVENGSTFSSSHHRNINHHIPRHHGIRLALVLFALSGYVVIQFSNRPLVKANHEIKSNGDLGRSSQQCIRNTDGRVQPRNWDLSRSNTGNTYRLHRLLQPKTATEPATKVLVFGGSMTAGSEVGGIKHAWPNIIANEAGLSHLNITNRGKGSTGSVWYASNLGKMLAPFDWDVIMLEVGMNDDSANSDCPTCRYNTVFAVTKMFETLVRRIRLLQPKAAIVVVEAFKQNNGFTTGQIPHDAISKYYELPVISIREAIWHDLDEDNRNKRVTPLTKAFPRKGTRKVAGGRWSGAHPNHEGQQLIADIIAHELCRFQNEPPSSDRERDLFPPLYIEDFDSTVMRIKGLIDRDFNGNINSNSNSNSSEWRYQYNFESPDYTQSWYAQKIETHIRTKGWNYVVQHTSSGSPRPGLICSDTQPNFARFDVGGCRSEFQVTFLKSYDTFGAASVVLQGPNNNHTQVLESRWPKSLGSGRYPEVIQFEKNSADFNTLTISLLADKDKSRQAFKLLEVKCV